MRSLLELLGIDHTSKSQRRANALAKADLELMRDLIRLRKDQGMSQQDVADRLGVSQATIASFERYDNDPKLSTIRRYAHAVEGLVAHVVVHDEGQLDSGDEWVTFSFKQIESSTAFTPSSAQRAINVDRGQVALAA